MPFPSRISASSKPVSEPTVQSAPHPGPSVISASDPSPILSGSHRWIVAIAVMSSAVMEVLDTSVVNVSLPHIAGSLSSSVEEATWVLTSYIVANAIILPITGWLAGQLFGAQAAANDCGDRIHAVQCFVWACPQPARA